MSVLEQAAYPIMSWRVVGEAAHAGDRRLAAERAAAAMAAHWQPDFGAWREYGQYWDLGVFEMDCFLSNPGCLLRLMLVDLPRMTIGEGPVTSWCQESVVLPAGWETIEVERLWARGQPHRLRAVQGKRTELVRVA